MKTTTIILALLFTGCVFSQKSIANEVLESDSIYDTSLIYAESTLYESTTIKDIEFSVVAPTLYLLELYMIEVREKSLEPSFEGFYDWTQEYFKEQFKD